MLFGESISAVALKRPGVHISLPVIRVIGVLSDLEVSVVLAFGFCRWTAPEAVHEPPHVVPGSGGPFFGQTTPESVWTRLRDIVVDARRVFSTTRSAAHLICNCRSKNDGHHRESANAAR
jgi:hypothetical protein